ncbi:hypothetical protein SUGI_0001300 [Cryptomeria japonica]|uniref:putative receptor protein kinase ZmPK1 n=1 Tax=Cryptomeria japonica TaxID=3369 RepID=UPI002408BFB1|nr:putative receptor protein kinase ZmPK1 [Cryptomeria japonica]GLJ04687.1 hypothetical protein SUGI_0001300 [Cryptomeria japonica]
MACPISHLLLLCLCVLYSAHHSHGLESLRPKSSLSPEMNETVLISSGGTFSAGFYAVGDNAYGFAIWYSQTPKPYTVVWMANRNQPVNGKKSFLGLQKDGDLVLNDAGGSIVWRSNTGGQAVEELVLLPTGNLVLRSSSGKIFWQSFDSPTDTVLPGQPITKDAPLVSRMGSSTFKSGYFSFRFNENNYLVLIYQGSNITATYWPLPWLDAFDNGRTTYNITRLAVLDDSGGFSSSDQFTFNASDYGPGPLRRLTLDIDGNLRLYSFNSQNQSWVVTWISMAEQCRVQGLCGPYAVCVYSPQAQCVCPPGFEMVDSTDWFQGCRLVQELSCEKDSVQLLELPYTDYYGFDKSGYSAGRSFEECRAICMDDCYCVGFAYRESGSGQCFPKSWLISGYQSPGINNTVYIKVSVNDSSVTNVSSLLGNSSSLQCSSPVKVELQAANVSSNKGTRNDVIIPMLSVVSAIGAAEIVCVVLGFWFLATVSREAHVYDRESYFSVPGGLRRFTFSQLKRATENFKDMVGKGGFGSVYKGVLVPENKVVAVKRLEGVFQGEEEFWAEISAIERVNHMNLVRMLGYCAEGKKKLLVYEYVENGSLDKYLFTQEPSKVLDWSKRFQVAVGTARGLAYLHEECLEWILHCDIKPQNILLDENFSAKVADFGMAKLVDRDRAFEFSRIRGTRGYLAPEWTTNLPITAKADVYSFGILLLELVSGQEATKFNVPGSGINFVQWAVENVNKGGKWMETLVDSKLGVPSGDEKREIEIVLKTALCCVEQNMGSRPSMSEVVQMLTFSIDMKMKSSAEQEDQKKNSAEHEDLIEMETSRDLS